MTVTESIQAPRAFEPGASAPREQFIQAMRMVASSVAVVTTDGRDGLHGATVSAFCSVSADPPTVLICLNGSTRIARHVAASAGFCLNILPQEMSHVADRFAGRHDGEISDRFDNIDHSVPPGHCPALAGALSLQCKTDSLHRSGSHWAVFGCVENITGAIQRPLTYLDGAYRPWLV